MLDRLIKSPAKWGDKVHDFEPLLELNVAGNLAINGNALIASQVAPTLKKFATFTASGWDDDDSEAVIASVSVGGDFIEYIGMGDYTHIMVAQVLIILQTAQRFITAMDIFIG